MMCNPVTREIKINCEQKYIRKKVSKWKTKYILGSFLLSNSPAGFLQTPKKSHQKESEALGKVKLANHNNYYNGKETKEKSNKKG